MRNPTRWILTAENTNPAELADAIAACGALGADGQPLTFPAEGTRDPDARYRTGEADYSILVDSDPARVVSAAVWARRARVKLGDYGIRARLYVARGEDLKTRRYDWDLTDPDPGGLVAGDLVGALEGCADNDQPLTVVTDTGRPVQILGVNRIGGGVEITVRALPASW